MSWAERAARIPWDFDPRHLIFEADKVLRTKERVILLILLFGQAFTPHLLSISPFIRD
jgi:hypothetical protein